MQKQSARHYRDGEEAVLDLIGSVYDASADTTRWPEFLGKLSSLHGGAAVGLFSDDDPNNSGRLSFSVRADPALEQRYERDFSAKNVFVAALRTLKEGEVRLGQHIIGDYTLVKSEYYTDWMAPQDMFHTIHSVATRDGPHVVRLAAARTKSAGCFDQTEVKVWKAVIPHLRRAIQIQKLNSYLSAARDVMDDGLSRRSVGLVLVRADGTVIDTNNFAERLLKEGDGLTVRSRKLVAERKDDQDRLDALISSATKNLRIKVYSGGNFLNLSRPSGRESYKMLIAPARVAIPFLDKKTSAAAVYISDPEIGIELNATEFRELYGFTEAESRVAVLIAKGLDVNGTARELGVSTNTVRTHLKRVFEKSGTKKQSHLVLKMLNSTL